MEAIISEKALHGVETYLNHQGVNIIEHGWSHGNDHIDLVAEEDGDMVFINCNICDDEGRGFENEHMNRAAMERIAAAYLAENGDFMGTVRFDCISVLVVGENRALLRHHRNCLSSEG